jgi:hypothetical protein
MVGGRSADGGAGAADGGRAAAGGRAGSAGSDAEPRVKPSSTPSRAVPSCGAATPVDDEAYPKSWRINAYRPGPSASPKVSPAVRGR